LRLLLRRRCRRGEKNRTQRRAENAAADRALELGLFSVALLEMTTHDLTGDTAYHETEKRCGSSRHGILGLCNPLTPVAGRMGCETAT
jgi:hypothetical protein